MLASHYLAAYRANPSGDEADALAAQARVALRAAAERATALHAPVGALDYLEQALEVTTDPLEQAALHERAGAAAATAARIQIGDEHGRKAGELYARSGDRLGVLRGRTLQARVMLAEHGDQSAIVILQEALADVADLPPAPEIVNAQSELARALMVQGSPEALVWCERVLENPQLTTQSVLVHTLITKGSALSISTGRTAEAEAVLRGAMVLADRLGEPYAMLRVRNNLTGITDPQSTQGTIDLAREVFEIGQRYGERTWVQQAIGSSLTGSFEIGRWDVWQEEARAEAPDAAGFYRAWFDAEEARRLAFRGRTDEADRILAEIWKEPAVQNSAQATAGISALEAEIRLTQGRWIEAFDVSRRGWNQTDNARAATQLSQFAAAAAGDASRLRDAVQAQESNLADESPDVAGGPPDRADPDLASPWALGRGTPDVPEGAAHRGGGGKPPGPRVATAGGRSHGCRSLQ